MYEEDDSVFVGREPCPSCGSEDNLARYSDGHAYCFGATCNHFEPPTDEGGDESDRPHQSSERPRGSLIEGEYRALNARQISEETCKLFSYKIGQKSGKTCHAAGYFLNGRMVAQKLRFANKKEGMPWTGEKAERKQVGLFGHQRFGKGKKIVITEGEIDAMTVSQVQGNKWPAVSLINGADGAKKDIANNLEYLANFDEIILMFDMDEPGRKAVEEAAQVLTGHRVLVASLPMKDANECHVNGKSDAIIQAIWNAKPYAPASVVFGRDIIDRRRNRPVVKSIPYPTWLPKFQEKTLGIRLGDLDVWTSGSGMGKTTLIKQLQVHLFRNTDYNQAIIHLEEPLEDTADDLIGVFMEKRLNLPEVKDAVPEADIHRAEEALYLAVDKDGQHRLYLHDAFGSMDDDDDLMNKIRYYAHAHNCKVIWIDHLSILVSGMGIEGDERRRIDELMHKLKELTVELNIYIGLISHLKKAQGNGPSFEEGAVPSLDDLRGSGGIKQLANNVYAMSRNQQEEHEIARHTARVHVLKCRYTGDTGPADFIQFQKLTGVFVEGVDPEFLKGFEDMTDDLSGEGQGEKDPDF